MSDVSDPTSRLEDALDALLPQHQCGKCGFSGCRPYAEAMARAEADIDRCPPGGNEGARQLALAAGVEPKPLNPQYGVEQPPALAFIDESRCIGCTLCIQACPVDAILGAAKFTHTVIASECTGCELCLPPCPVDCIVMLPAVLVSDPDLRRQNADRARRRYRNREARKLREQREREESSQRRKAALERGRNPAILDVIARAKARAAQGGTGAPAGEAAGIGGGDFPAGKETDRS